MWMEVMTATISSDFLGHIPLAVYTNTRYSCVSMLINSSQNVSD